jgi:uncharacterized glyoxalase superfamily protein PhnB
VTENLYDSVPVFRVADFATAEAFYRDRLDFQKQWENRPHAEQPNPVYAEFTRDGIRIHLSSFSGDGALGGVANLYVRDVDALHREFVARDTYIHLEPTDQTWGTREMYVKDPDGNCLRFVQERDA